MRKWVKVQVTLYYHKLFTKGEELDTVCSECKAGSRGCVACKKELTRNIQKFLEPIRERRKYYEENPEVVQEILDEGTKKAQETSKATLKDVKKAMKIDY